MPESPNPKIRDVPEPPEGDWKEADLPYAELDVVTNFSFLRGASHADELMLAATSAGLRAVAVTDVNTLAGVVRMFDAARKLKAHGGWAPKLIVGARLSFEITDGAGPTPDVLVWAPDRPAYARLSRLLTLGRMRAGKGKCRLGLDDLLDPQYGDGLLAAVVPPVGLPGEVSSVLPDLRAAFGDRLSIATSLAFGPHDDARVKELLAVSRRFRVPLLATNAVHYHHRGRRPLQDVLTCIRHGCTIHQAGYRLFPNGERYLKSPDQMHRLFAALPGAIRHGLDVADHCTFKLDELAYEYPDEVVPPGRTMDQHLRELTYAGAAKRYPEGIPDKVRGLLEKELTFICGSQYAPYFLTVHDLVCFARSQGILCQGRGSAANSAVCYCLGVTSVDPAKFQLVFERFASAARHEPPDIDIDFEHERREEVIQYVYNKYGRDRAGMTATVITYRGRSAVRDVGKALGLGQDLLDQLAGRLDWWHRGTLTSAQLAEAGVDASDPTIAKVVALTGELLGFPRHLSQHTGGMVIARGALSEIVPIENASMKDRTVIEWDKDDIDTLGMFKVDCLGLGMLTVLSKGLALASAGRGKGERPLELHTLPHEDPATYAMLCDADSIGVFQVESRAQMSMLPRLKPEKFFDLVIEVAIVRPGPIQGNMVHPYLRRRNREEPVSFPKPELEEVLGETLGVPLFQEQAMRLAVVAAGFTAVEADQLRRSMATWRRSDGIHVFHDKFVNGMVARGYDPKFAADCFAQVSGFGEYGFPESHAASFAKLVYASAWLKRHHPAAFACALLNSQPMGFYAPAQIVIDARNHGVEVRTIDVNHSEWDCTLEQGKGKGTRGGRPDGSKATWGLDGPVLRLGFRQVKGLREDHARQLVAARPRVGRFASVTEFHRVARLAVATIRRLAEADAFGSMGLTRRKAVWHALELKDDRLPLFDQETHAPCLPSPPLPSMPLGQEVMTDYATHGLSLKRHPVSFVRNYLTRHNVITTAELQDERRSPHGRWVKVSGLVLVRQRPGTASGVVFETIEDETGAANLILWADVYDRYRPAARHATLVQAEGYVQREGQVVHVLAKRLFDLSHLIQGVQSRSRDFH